MVSQIGQQNAKGKGKGKKGDYSKEIANKKNMELTCHKCGEKGHLRKDCPYKSNKEKDKEKGKEKESSSFACIACASEFVHIELVEQKLHSSHPMGLGVLMTRDWIMDSGATQHMTLVKKGTQNLYVVDGKIHIGDKSLVQIQGISDLDLIPNGFGGTYTCEEFYAPSLHYDLLLVCELGKVGLQIEFDEDHYIFWETVKIAIGSEDNGIYKLANVSMVASIHTFQASYSIFGMHNLAILI